MKKMTFLQFTDEYSNILKWSSVPVTFILMKMKTFFFKQHTLDTEEMTMKFYGTPEGKHKYFFKISHIYHLAKVAMVTPNWSWTWPSFYFKLWIHETQ